MVILRHTFHLLIFLIATFCVNEFATYAQSDDTGSKPGDNVEGVLKTGRVVVGALIRDGASLIELRVGSGKDRCPSGPTTRWQRSSAPALL